MPDLRPHAIPLRTPERAGQRIGVEIYSLISAFRHRAKHDHARCIGFVSINDQLIPVRNTAAANLPITHPATERLPAAIRICGYQGSNAHLHIADELTGSLILRSVGCLSFSEARSSPSRFGHSR